MSFSKICNFKVSFGSVHNTYYNFIELWYDKKNMLFIKVSFE